jgi:hypothetical protein
MKFARLSLLFVTSVTVSMLAACAPDKPGEGDDDDGNGVDGGGGGFIDARPGGEFIDAGVAMGECNKIDFLFVVDDSGSMAEEQDNLEDNFPLFVDIINQYMTSSGQALDYRLAVTTTGRTVTTITQFPPPIGPVPMTEVGMNGGFREEPGCGMTRPWFERTDPNLATNFGCAAKVDTSGPSMEMPLLCTELALSDRVADGTNAGFLREDALLAIVILTDENDCSRPDDNFTLDLLNPAMDPCNPSQPQLVPPAHYVDFLDQLKGERGRWAVAVIAGPTACSSAFGDAAEATRLKDFVSETGQNAIFSSICTGNLATAISDALDTFQAACDDFPPID